jgi:predicted CXXCH cytochrome family protein
MSRNRFRLRRWPAPILLGGFVFTSGLLLASRDAVAQESCVSAQCHATLLNARNVHPPTETCDTCHESVATPHPQKGRKTFKLAQEPPGLCANCHEPFGKKKNIHPPAKEGMCTTCHNPHASDQPKLLAQPLKELCQSCHEAQTSAKYGHGPVAAGECTVCHAPHESDQQSLLLKPGEEWMCFSCHLDLQELLKKKNVHPALSGGCTSCHNPHGAAHPKLLAEEGAQLCFQCHDPIAAKVAKSPVVHGAVKDPKSCASCHSPHASDNAKLLLKPEKETCLGCHASVLTRDMTMFHGPINQGMCTPCHDPHGSQNARLLVKEFPAGIYVPYTDTEFALCFSCHKRDLLQYPDTSFATNFRDGERNLHYLHVNNKQKGRSCVLCHNLHGSRSPKLIAESVPFGKWNLPLKFVKNPTGGSCAPGCHRQQAYDRQSPVKKLAVPKPAGTGR